MAKRQRRAGDDDSKNGAVQAEPRGRKLITQGGDDAPTFYANNTSLGVSLFDFRLQFGELVEASMTELTVRARCTIFMSPQHAKVMAKLLSDKVKEYEQSHGEISIKTPTSDQL